MSDSGIRTAGDMLKATYDPDADGKIALAQLVATVCSETEVVPLVEDADFYVEATGSAGYLLIQKAEEATLADFQANAGTGTMDDPEDINVNIPGARSKAHNINDYIEIDFGKWVRIDQWRIYGHTNNNEDGVWKLQYYGKDLAWHDWKTGIPTNKAVWTSMASETEVVCLKVKIICTTVDSFGFSSGGELEVYHS